MRLEVNYLVIATHIMLCLIINYLLIVGSIKYDRITPIMMRLEVNYLVIATHIMVCLTLNYLIIAPPSLKCSTRWIVQPMSKNWKIQASVTSWTIRNK